MAAPLGYGINGTMALHAIADGRLDITPMITGRVGLGGVVDAFSSLEKPDEHAKIIITFD